MFAIEIINENKYSLLAIAISFVFKALMDISARDGFKNWWFNKSLSWQNKYAKGLAPNYKHWYYFGLYTTSYKERFLLSSTALVFITDGWHLFQFFFLNSIIVAISIGMDSSFVGIATSFIIVRIVYAICFNVPYKLISNGTNSR